MLSSVCIYWRVHILSRLRAWYASYRPDGDAVGTHINLHFIGVFLCVSMWMLKLSVSAVCGNVSRECKSFGVALCTICFRADGAGGWGGEVFEQCVLHGKGVTMCSTRRCLAFVDGAKQLKFTSRDIYYWKALPDQMWEIKPKGNV